MKSTTLLFTESPSSRCVGMFDGEIEAIAPLAPGSQVVAKPRIPEQPQRQVRVRRAIPALTIRHHLAILGDARLLAHRAQLCGRLERAVRPQVARPLEMNGAWNDASARRADRGPA